MTKRGPLNKTEKKYILENRNLGAKVICAQLNRPEEQVQRLIEENKVEAAPAPEAVNQTKKETHAMKLYARQTGGRGRSGIVIMTPAASQNSDETRQKTKMPESLKSAIHKPLGG